jgi:hypothetical protein
MATKLTLLESSADETGNAFVLPLSRQQAVGQITITGTQTVSLQGRIDNDHDWGAIKEISATEPPFLFTLAPEIRVVTTATSGGSSVTSMVY